ncbi:hypothetical protein P168DRAFT_310634 [Aspergillus campestris IBT 28561]|uniref:Microbial-type PARG catalytic domain-containing protein n=1 Tax=Aspergillus campestris (strain IBT 28561) TaxID=1392248 RepID=A0A2I1D5T7_ASPC2|nr:uncharacterized protein P168DRAFT_310634 [Aspergillus campestris IBT 28561]PKY05241.1 hypothetical protein P168DRAFT_310634 [Aspergillus campestris IBT 28561]
MSSNPQNSKPPSNSKPTGPNRREILRATAEETKSLLPQLLALRPQAPPNGYYYAHARTRVLDARYKPKNLSTTVEVVNADTYDTAIDLAGANGFLHHDHTAKVCVLNLASEKHAGGGWLRGAMAQEEALCYRSSLSFTLKRRFYPIRDRDAIYSPTVLIMRGNFDQGHKLMDLQRPELFPVVSVVSVAAVRRPEILNANPPRFKHIADRHLTKDKMRAILRVAAYNRQRRLVLGALGCGAFANPKQEVADCWAEVLQEQEFQGWWERIVFAVLENPGGPAINTGNFNTFRSKLQGLRV